MWMSSCFSTNHLLQAFSFLHYIAFHPLLKIRWHIYMGLFLLRLFISITLLVYSFANITLDDYHSFIVSLKVGWCPSSDLFISLNIELPLLGLFSLYMNSGVSLSISTNWITGILIEIAMNLSNKLERIDILTLFNLPLHKHRQSLHI